MRGRVLVVRGAELAVGRLARLADPVTQRGADSWKYLRASEHQQAREDEDEDDGDVRHPSIVAQPPRLLAMDRQSTEEERSASLQERHAAQSICFGCGPANDQGLHIRSFPEGDECVSQWTPDAHHQAVPGMLNGGIIGTLMDCHSNWAAAHHLMQKAAADHPPTTVTADFHVRLLKPTPSGGPVHLRARVAESAEDRATIETTLSSGDVVTATCRGTFVAVRPGHPAYHRW